MDLKQQYGLIGNPLTHSFSKDYFEKKIKEKGLENLLFNNYELEKIEDLLPIISNNEHLLGFAVTIPFKQKIIKYLDEFDRVVGNINSCNCVLIKNKKLIGYNTDVLGFEKSFTPLLKSHHKHALILGDGGAAQAVKYVLRHLHIYYTIVTRVAHHNSICYADVTKQIIDEHPIIINTTPLGTFPNVDDCPNIPYKYLTKQHYLFDLVYNPIVTTFMANGLLENATVKNGYEMLCIQAEENWKIWNDL
ncbi:MAG: shikimate dehydrogenase [Bacteroidetes bacterium]|nr:shikimate dehydrogenase [Bacteroidota bacterium]